MKQAQSADGVIHEFPDNTPDTVIDKVMATYARRQRLDKAAAEARANPELRKAREERVDVGSRFWQGMKDPVVGAAQAAWNMMPESYRSLTPDFNEYIAAKESQYQADRNATGQDGVDVARMVGNIATTAPLAAAAPVGQAAGMGAKVLQGAALGGGMAAATPVTEGDDFWQEKAKQAAAGAAGGAAITPISAGAARLVRPVVDKGKKALMDAGVTLTPGQALGPAAKRMEEKLRSVPFLGDMITKTHFGQREAFNKATYNKVLSTINEKFPKTGQVGEEGVRYVRQRLSDAYERLLPNVKFVADRQFYNEVDKVIQMVDGTLPESVSKQFQKILKTQVADKLTTSGRMSGESLKRVERVLGEKARGYLKSFGDADKQELGRAIREVQEIVRKTVARATPQHAIELANINKGWSQFKVVESASNMLGAKDGIFTPAQFSKYARKHRLLNEFARAGERNLSQAYPDSGTAGRLLPFAAGGSAAMFPTETASMLGLGMLGYTQPAQKALQYLLAGQRPGMMGPLSNAVGIGGPLLGGIAGERMTHQ